METWLIVLLWTAPPLVDRLDDPSPSVWQNRRELRDLECVRMPQAVAHERYPGLVPEPAPRAGTMVDIDALVCQRRVVSLDSRAPRDEAVLSSLSRSVRELTQGAQAVGAPRATWHVEAFYPNPAVARKLAAAARTDLAERGLSVSERVPVLAAGDLAVLRGLSPRELYPWACRRFFEGSGLRPDDAFLGIMLLDERETQLHAGVCQHGRWSWLR